jgi:hypothetical protein
MGVITSLLIGACIIAQVRADRREAPARRALTSRVEAITYEMSYRALRTVAMLGEPLLDPRVVIRTLQGVADVLDRDSIRADYRGSWNLAITAQSRALTDGEQREFEIRLGHLARQLLDAIRVVLDRDATRVPYRTLHALAITAQSRTLSDQEKTEAKQLAADLLAKVRGELELRMREFWEQPRPSHGARNRPD